MPKINVIFHSVSGHTFRLAEAIAEGVAEVPRCQANLLLISEPNGAKPITMPGLENVVLAALTGWGQEADRRRTAEAGFNHHLVKPVDLAELQALLHILPTQ